MRPTNLPTVLDKFCKRFAGLTYYLLRTKVTEGQPTIYTLIWNDGDKTFIGDMTPFQWPIAIKTILTGVGINERSGIEPTQDDFDEAVKVRLGESNLQIFQPEILENP